MAAFHLWTVSQDFNKNNARRISREIDHAFPHYFYAIKFPTFSRNMPEL